MRWVIISLAAAFFVTGCGGLERQNYPVNESRVHAVGVVKHIQPYTGKTSESGLSRALWGAAAGGIVGIAAGFADKDIDSFDAYSYLVITSKNEVFTIRSYMKAEVGDCVAIYRPEERDLYTVVNRPVQQCES
ncbi:hypothetical protein [Marinobacterium rhizophilum]|uniref:Outer membrane lipoprotein n=1 Tax=Marinobacterium rhizophilum TaxID=420402 RepID=A0ABY5HLX7_9GAMM|nr:hypothetical protein [Marinobacterium rhizophilum]UTW12817.1 hypothetical protein KDW95_03835 [Marinobacterium rhizophilum]